MPITPEELEKRFTYHAPRPGQPAIYEQIRYSAKELATTICALTPESREQSLAITALEECVSWAAIAYLAGLAWRRRKQLAQHERLCAAADAFLDEIGRRNA